MPAINLKGRGWMWSEWISGCRLLSYSQFVFSVPPRSSNIRHSSGAPPALLFALNTSPPCPLITLGWPLHHLSTWLTHSHSGSATDHHPGPAPWSGNAERNRFSCSGRLHYGLCFGALDLNVFIQTKRARCFPNGLFSRHNSRCPCFLCGHRCFWGCWSASCR